MRPLITTRDVLSASVIIGFALAFGDEGAAREDRCASIDLKVWRSEAAPSQYAEFCSREPKACELSGQPIIDWEATRSRLEQINREVNADITLVPDTIGEGAEECWEFPVDGTGDCEDLALEKRRRLVAEGLPSAALNMAIVHHRTQFFPHAVLLAETTSGTRVLDNLIEEIICWDAAPYRYERRARPDGTWERYVVQ